MTSQNTPSEYPTLQNVDNGCDTLRFLWAISVKDFDMTHPGISGIGARLSSFVEIERVPVFMQMAALKCWEERTRAAAPNKFQQQQNVEFPPMPTPGFDQLHRAKSTKVNTSSGSSGSSSGSSSSSGSK